jgi:hypothetical protein
VPSSRSHSAAIDVVASMVMGPPVTAPFSATVTVSVPPMMRRMVATSGSGSGSVLSEQAAAATRSIGTSRGIGAAGWAWW